MDLHIGYFSHVQTVVYIPSIISRPTRCGSMVDWFYFMWASVLAVYDSPDAHCCCFLLSDYSAQRNYMQYTTFANSSVVNCVIYPWNIHHSRLDLVWPLSVDTRSRLHHTACAEWSHGKLRSQDQTLLRPGDTVWYGSHNCRSRSGYITLTQRDKLAIT